jgi:transcription antitermination protein NusB
MISRRILRIKVMQALYAYYKHNGESSLKKSEQEMLFSINKTYDLYHYFFLLILDIADYASSRIELAKQKKIPSNEDLHPNTKFIDNKLIEQLRINSQLLNYLNAKKLSWINHTDLIKELYSKLIESTFYQKYMAEGSYTYKGDLDLVCNMFSELLGQHEPLYQVLEEQSIYWNDEGEFILGINIKTIKKFREDQGADAKLLSLYKSSEDQEFPKKLIRKVILNSAAYSELIKKYSKNWEVDRIAFMDILLMQMAIAEVIEFSSIPMKVTLNEYLELAKFYSTSRSNIFINGILDKVFAYLKENKQIKKTGRGLIGDE